MRQLPKLLALSDQAMTKALCILPGPVAFSGKYAEDFVRCGHILTVFRKENGKKKFKETGI